MSGFSDCSLFKMDVDSGARRPMFFNAALAKYSRSQFLGLLIKSKLYNKIMLIEKDVANRKLNCMFEDFVIFNITFPKKSCKKEFVELQINILSSFFYTVTPISIVSVKKKLTICHKIQYYVQS